MIKAEDYINLYKNIIQTGVDLFITFKIIYKKFLKVLFTNFLALNFLTAIDRVFQEFPW